jgi:hypothetical protein
VKSAQPRLVLGLEGMGFNDTDPASTIDERGFHNPERYRELKYFAHAEHKTDGWLLEARPALGELRETSWFASSDESDLYAWQRQQRVSAGHGKRLHSELSGREPDLVQPSPLDLSET